MRFVPPRRLLRLGAIAAATAVSAACTTVGPDYRLPEGAVVSQPAAVAPFEGAQASRTSPDAPHAHPYSQAPLPTHWWRLYQDPLLDQLVGQALARNADLRQAAANLQRVQALEAEVDGASQPVIGVNGGPSYGHASGLSQLQPGRQPRSDTHYGTGLSVSYQVDLLGQLRRASEAAHAGTQAASAALDLARVSVAAGTARAYADVCSLGLRLQSARRSAELQQEAVAMTQRLEQAGRASSIDVARAQSQAQTLLAALPPLHAQREGAVYRLAVLTGTPPQAFPREVTACVAPPQVTGLLPVGDGARMLRRHAELAGLKSTQISALSTTDLGELTATQIGGLNRTQMLSLTATQVGALTGCRDPRVRRRHDDYVGYAEPRGNGRPADQRQYAAPVESRDGRRAATG